LEIEETIEGITQIIPPEKLNSTNLGAVMGTVKKLVPEGIVDVCINLFNKIKHLETGSTVLLYDITSTYFYSTKLPKARFGHNKDESNQPQINISLVCTKNKGLPIFFRHDGILTWSLMRRNKKRINLLDNEKVWVEDCCTFL
jgi:transposase